MFRIITIDELLKLLDNYKHKEIHVHHTWSPSHKNFTGNNGIQLQEAMKRYHTNTNGWSDIGQHVTLLPDGLFVTGRDFGTTPASITGYNTGAFAVEMLGNFDIGNDVLQGEQKSSILRLCRYFHDNGRYIRFHWENAAKTCPGTSIYKEKFIQEVIDLDKAVPQKPFSDWDQISNWAKPYVEQVKELGIMIGDTNGNFNPQAPVTREQLAKIICSLKNT